MIAVHRYLAVIIALGINVAVFAAAPTDQNIDKADGGDVNAQISVGIALVALPGAGNSRRGRHYLELAVNQGSARAAQQLGYLSLGNDQLAADSRSAKRFYELAVAQEDPIALYEYGLALHTGQLLPADTERGLALIRRAAELDVTAARVYLADFLRTTSEKKNAERAADWMATLSPGRRAFGAALLSIDYEHAPYLPADPEREQYWQRRIPEDLHAMAVGEVASYFSSGTHVRKDDQFSAALFKSVMSSGEPSIINNFSWLLATSMDISVRNGDQAVRLMLAMMEQHGDKAMWLDTLAAAYAEAGNFELAIATQTEAVQIFAEDNSDDDGFSSVRLDYFKDGRPWRE